MKDHVTCSPWQRDDEYLAVWTWTSSGRNRKESGAMARTYVPSGFLTALSDGAVANVAGLHHGRRWSV